MALISTYLFALLVLLGTITIGYLIVQLPGIRRSFLPASVAAGLLLLILGPQVMGRLSLEGAITAELYAAWEPLPGLLISVIFGALFLGRPLLTLRGIWRAAAPQAAFGQMIAWGYYAVAGIVTLAILIPVFQAHPLSAALLEISFEGGHGTAAGMMPVFEEFGFETGQEMAVALATTSLLATLISGFMLISYGKRKKLIRQTSLFSEIRGMVYHRRILYQLRKSGVSLREELGLGRVFAHIMLVIGSVALGWALHAALLQLEQLTWGASDLKIVGYMPAFTFCMFGGMIAQVVWHKVGGVVSRPLIELISGATLAVLVASAIATMKLDFFTTDGATFAILAVSGVMWTVFSFLILARRMFRAYWFENAIVSVGQSMGTTATGLLFAKIVDPKQRTGVVESFGYKQLLFEPLMGGGLVTALSMPLIMLLGLPLFTMLCTGVCIGWMVFGLIVFRPR